MRINIIFLAVLMLMSCNFEVQKDEQKIPILSQIHEFDVVSFFSPYDDMDCEMIFQSIVGSFEKIGLVKISHEKSVFSLNSTSSRSPCVLSIGKTGNEIKISLKIGSEAEILANKSKAICTIWEKTISLLTLDPNPIQRNLDIAKITADLIADFSKDYFQSNPKDIQPVFYIKNFSS